MQTPSHSMLKIDCATVQRNDARMISNLSLDIPEGQHTAIVGPNGSGKSTLIKVIARQLHALAHSDGRPVVSIFGKANWNVFELRTLLGIVSPDLHNAFTGAGGITGLDAVVSGYFASQGTASHHKVTSEMKIEAASALAELGALNLADKSMDVMSAGEARRVLIARALVHHPRALLLDEPTTGLDIAARRKFLETLRMMAAQKRTLLLVTHHIDEIIPEIERIVFMKNGSVFADGAKKEVLTSTNLSAVFGAEISVRSASHGYYSAEFSSDDLNLSF